MSNPKLTPFNTGDLLKEVLYREAVELDNDKDLRQEILYEFLNQFKEDKYLSQGNTDKAVGAIDQYTQSKLKAFAGEFEKAIGEEIMCYDSTDISHKFMSCDTCQSNMKNYELRQALKAIKERWINE